MTDFINDTRNVIDKYKGLSVEEIRSDLDSTRLPFITVLENINGDFNKSSVIRSHNGFNGAEVWIVGKKKWDKRGAVGTYNYEHIRYFSGWDEVAQFFASPPGDYSMYEWVGVDNVEGAEPLDTFLWGRDTLMLFGEEGHGLSPEAISYCDRMVYIPMRGSVRSFNVASAATVIMYDYVNGVKE